MTSEPAQPSSTPPSSTQPSSTQPSSAPTPFADRADDRDNAPQYVLPLVVRIERTDPPGHTDALETAARAVLNFLSDERVTAPEGAWAAAVAAWEDARIRKVVRRARGAEWRKASELPGLTTTGKTAEVRVFPPIPLDGWPKELAKLQVSGTELTDDAPLAPADPDTPVLWLNPDVEMSTGKSMAQVGHAAQLAWWALAAPARAAWKADGFPLAVRPSDAAAWASLTASGLPFVRDAGFTEIAPGSCTVVADHPALRR
ncbi:peptidyl-tRNA hydrolase [Streptacidiphilus melanogenes]|uniref:peptidyl-tRNA hydrolase n=1 Tax=Streptacidiphilus melanogenes TaxID=411235 RepID=UPI0005A7618E